MDLGLYWEHDFTADGPVSRATRAAWQVGLADDLARYLAGEPVSVSRTGAVSQLVGAIGRVKLQARFGDYGNQLLALGDLKTTAEEGAKIAVTPAAFGPVCSKHETLRSDPDTFGVTIDPGTGPTAMFEVWDDWRAGNAKQLVTSAAGDTVCPK